jgi:hypothetical protein
MTSVSIEARQLILGSNILDLAIWDNRSVVHCVTWDYDHLGKRMGKRALCVGERPYLDPKSTSRQESLNAAFKRGSGSAPVS